MHGKLLILLGLKKEVHGLLLRDGSWWRRDGVCKNGNGSIDSEDPWRIQHPELPESAPSGGIRIQ
jgi:hypothetical protein